MNTATAGEGGDRVARFRRVIARRLGLHLDDSKLPVLEALLRSRTSAGPGTDDDYLNRLESAAAAGAHELGVLAEALTVPETYFFRNEEQLRVFVQVCLPARLRARATEGPAGPAASRPRLRILSAGCASGEEAYSLAMLLLENSPLLPPGWELARNVSIEAFDINPAVLARAARGRFSSWSLRETDDLTRTRWFRADGRDAVLADEVRALVRFEQRNLLDEDGRFWWPESVDIVFCRNVLMYLTAEAARAAVARIAGALVPGGYLFLGHAETLRGLSHDFQLCHTHDTFYYQRKGGPAGRPAPDGTSSAWEWRAGREAGQHLVAVVDRADSWVQAIQQATERIGAMTAPTAAAVANDPAGPPQPPRSRIDPALELLRRERFGDALAVVGALPADEATSPEAMLLRAVLLTQAGELAQAQVLANELLRVDDLDAGAHYVLALCREGAGDPAGAAEHDRLAIHIDATFAMPRLHLGLLARRRGDLEEARRELGAALPLLGGEEPARVLLFGGGFGREALVALCRAELGASGGAA